MSLGIQNQLLAQLLEHWNIQRPDMVAHDFGGATALRTHLLDGKDYRSLTLIDPVALTPWGSPFVQHVRLHEAAFSGLPDYIQRAIVPTYIRGAIHREIPDDELAPYVQPWLGDPGQAAFYRQIAQMDERYTRDAENKYPNIRCPVQILWGEEDQWIPIERGRALHNMIPGSQFHPIPTRPPRPEDARKPLSPPCAISLSPDIPCRSCRRLRSLPLIPKNKIKRSQPRSSYIGLRFRQVHCFRAENS